MNPTVLHLFSGAGGGALGFQRAGFTSVGAFDVDPQACAALEYLTGERATVADLGTMEPHELRAACSGPPDVVFSSPPCKGNSGCLPSSQACTPRYQEMNSWAMRGIWLALEAWPEAPPKLILVENVPRITVRSRGWLDQLQGLLAGYGYAVRETRHDCGELGGLAQHRDRFLLVARHMKQVPEFLYEPPKLRVRGVGEVLGSLPVPLPGSTEGGPMHRLPRLSPLNWVRLALIPAGGDWRNLPETVELTHRPGRQNGGFGVNAWDTPGHTVVGEGSVRNTWASVQDPRVVDNGRYRGGHGVKGWDDASATIRGAHEVRLAPASIADPRVNCKRREGGHGVRGWDQPSRPIIGHGSIHNHPSQVADPRLTHPSRRGNLGVTGWAEPSHTVIGDALSYKGANIADLRCPVLIGPKIDLGSKRPCHLVIQAADGTWHRPLTTLELAALQGLPVRHRGGWLDFGVSQSKARQFIGNMVPPPTAETIGRAMIPTLQASADGTFLMSSAAVWVDRPEAR